MDLVPGMLTDSHKARQSPCLAALVEQSLFGLFWVPTAGAAATPVSLILA